MSRPFQRPFSPTEEETAFGRAGRAVKTLLIRAGAVSLILLAGMAILSIASFSISDPSLSNATAREASNWIGSFGAKLADVLLQLFGGAALVLPIPLVIWGLAALRLGTPDYTPAKAWLRFCAWVVGTLCFAGFAGALPLAADWPFVVGMGGFLGVKMLALFAVPFAAIGLPGAALFASTILLSLGIWLVCFASRVQLIHFELALEALFNIKEEVAYIYESVVERFTGESASEDDGEVEDDRKEPLVASTKRQKLKLATVNGSHEDEAAEESDASLKNTLKSKRKIIREKKKNLTPVAEQTEFPVFSAAKYKFPPLNLMAMPTANDRLDVDDEQLEQNARMLETVLADFGVRGEITNVRPGPVVTLYELEPAAGVKSSRVINLADDIARSMSAIACRVAVVPGRNAIGIELPNLERETVFLREMLAAPGFERTKGALTISLGKNIGGEPEFADLAKMPHLLIAGTTGSGKSVGINTMILSLLYRMPPDQCKLIMVDPKMLELSVYEGIPHLLAPVVTDPSKAVVALKWTVREMEERYKKMSKVGVRNITGFNERIRDAESRGENLNRTVHTGYDSDTGEPVYESEDLDYQTLPYIVVVIDEVADLMMVAGKDIEAMVQRLAQMARAAGIHLIMATQRPSVDVITGTIKANFPTRISFQVTSKIDSRTILGDQGAEQLLGQGDMLFMAGGGRLTRVHGSFVTDDEVEKIVRHLKKQGKPDYVQAVTELEEQDLAAGLGLDVGGNTSSGDAMYDQAVAIVARDRKASTSYIQRRLQIGYNRAATLIERMEEQGIISPANHAGKREVLIGEDAA